MSISPATDSIVRAIAWDPKSPATLLLPTVDASGDTPAFVMDKLLSHDGVGCNTHESSALMNLIDAYGDYLESKERNWTAFRSLSKAYRMALCQCLQGWEKDLAGQEPDAATLENLELLKIVYAVTHLSETFLLLPPTDSALDYYENAATMPGAVTADTVRYLRNHHMGDVTAAVDENSLKQILDSLQPDQIENGSLYWKLVFSYLLRGCLEEVWALLSRHSMCRRCFDETLEPLDEYHAATLAEDRDGFLALRDILLSAPLPGGRNEEYDAALDFSLQDDEESEEEYLEGIPTSAYRLWETNAASREMGDLSLTYNPYAASQMYQSWMQALTQIPAVHKLKRRIPQISTILNVMSGNLKSMEFDSWAEALCAELLYKLPSVRPDDMHARAFRWMEALGTATKGGFEEVILSVMKGNAGRVIEVMHELGGGSGAALPAVMV